MSADDNDFDIAKKVTDLLKGIGKDRQQKILRWVAENFDVPLAAGDFSQRIKPARAEYHASDRLAFNLYATG